MYEVEPRQFEGRLLHQLPPIKTEFGEAYAEVYLAEPTDVSRVALTRLGTRVIEDLGTLPGLDHVPWTSRYLQGLIDTPFLNLTPGTRSGIIQDERFAALIDALEPLETHLKSLIDEQQRAEEEQASQQSFKAIQKAFQESLLALPPEECDWFDIQSKSRHDTAMRHNASADANALALEEGPGNVREPPSKESPQRQFFEVAGPLFSVVVSPAASNVALNDRRKFRALPRDRSRRRVIEDRSFAWEILEGEGSLVAHTDQEVEFNTSRNWY